MISTALLYGLGIELDGGIHDDMIVHQKDEEKEACMNKNGITILRFPNEVVFQDFEYIKECILKYKREFEERL